MAKFKVGDQVVFNSVPNVTPVHFSRFNGMTAKVTAVFTNDKDYQIRFPSEPMDTMALEDELTHAAVPSNGFPNPAVAPSQPSNSVTPPYVFNFKVNDRVSAAMPGTPFNGMTFTIRRQIVWTTGPAYTLGGNGVTFDAPERALTLVQSFDSMTLREVADAKIKELEQCGRIARKIKPKCPACGLADEGNYVGFSTVECMNRGCIHHKVKEHAHG